MEDSKEGPDTPAPFEKTRQIGRTKVSLGSYIKTHGAAGKTSYHCGDGVATKLDNKTLDEVYDIVSRALGVEREALVERYKHLNAGMQRMALGNKYRHHLMQSVIP